VAFDLFKQEIDFMSAATTKTFQPLLPHDNAGYASFGVTAPEAATVLHLAARKKPDSVQLAELRGMGSKNFLANVRGKKDEPKF
jgi:hypothetical protein